jgi:hypothetical protein
MEDFNLTGWFKNQYLTEAGEGTTKATLLATAINDVMIEIDDSMSYKDFASAVATILQEEYGTHNFAPFMEILHAELGINESLNENENNALAKEIESSFGGDPYVDMRDGKNGTITFRERSEFPDSEWGEILDFLKSKGFEITSESNYYDIEPGEREWFPKINITSNTTSI